MKEMQLTYEYETLPVRTYTDGDIIWFVGKDVAAALGYSNYRDALSKHVDTEDKKTVAIRDGNRGNPNTTIINEAGVYALIFGSELESAKKFKHWVTHDVLPSIRKRGYYSALAPSETIAAIVNDVNDTERRKILIDGIRMSAIDQTQFISEYMGISDRSIPDRMVTLSGRNRMAKQRMRNWGKRIYTFNDVKPPKPIEDFILLASLNRAKRGKYTANCFVEFCGTTYFSTDGYRALIEVLRRDKRITEDETTEWINSVANQWFTGEAK